MRSRPHYHELHTFRGKTEQIRHWENGGTICGVAWCRCRHDMMMIIMSTRIRRNDMRGGLVPLQTRHDDHVDMDTEERYVGWLSAVADTTWWWWSCRHDDDHVDMDTEERYVGWLSAVADTTWWWWSCRRNDMWGGLVPLQTRHDDDHVDMDTEERYVGWLGAVADRTWWWSCRHGYGGTICGVAWCRCRQDMMMIISTWIRRKLEQTTKEMKECMRKHDAWECTYLTNKQVQYRE